MKVIFHLYIVEDVITVLMNQEGEDETPKGTF